MDLLTLGRTLEETLDIGSRKKGVDRARSFVNRTWHQGACSGSVSTIAKSGLSSWARSSWLNARCAMNRLPCTATNPAQRSLRCVELVPARAAVPTAPLFTTRAIRSTQRLAATSESMTTNAAHCAELWCALRA